MKKWLAVLLAQDCSFSNRLTVSGTVHLILQDGCTMTASAGINVTGSNALHIYGQSQDRTQVGKLVATGRNDDAAIGGDGSQMSDGQNCGAVRIHSGEVQATVSVSFGAGIGGGSSVYRGGNGGDIRITGGFVNAQSDRGAGIGGGYSGGNGGNIIIEGGEVAARTTNGGAGIGGGSGGAGGVILIRGGKVTATSDQYGAGIGGGVGADGGTVTIEGGSVTANGGTFGGAGIGGGQRTNTNIGGSSGTIIICGDAQVTATGGNAAGSFSGGAGIGSGGGFDGQPGTVDSIVVSVPVNATGGAGNASFGGGAKIGSGGSVTSPGTEASTKIILTKPNPTTVDTGARVNFSVAIEPVQTASYAWQKRNGAGWTGVGTDITSFSILNAQPDDGGDYRCVVTINTVEYPTETVRLTIKEAQPSAGIDYAREQLTGLARGANYTVNGNAEISNAAGNMVIDSAWFGKTLSIVKAASNAYCQDSAAQTLTIPARPDAPTTLGKVDETSAGAKNGKITGVTNKMEYKLSTAANWTDCTGTEVAGLAPGSYQVRIKAVANTSFAGSPANVTISAGPTSPSKSQPVVSGSNALSGTEGEVGAKVVSVELTNASFGSGLEFTCAIGGIEVKVTATRNGNLVFNFTADQLNALAEGSYDILVSSAGNSENYAVSETKVGTLSIGVPIPTTWTMPTTFKATKGFSYQLAKASPDGREPPALTFTRSNKNAAIDGKGVLTAKATGTVTIKATDTSGASKKCKVTVVANSYTRSMPLMLAGGGVFSSTKKIYYKNKRLCAEVFVLNRSGKSIKRGGELRLELWRGDELLYTKPITSWKPGSTPKNKKYAIYKLSVKESALAAVSTKAFDLGRGEIQAVIAGTDVYGNIYTPLTPKTPGATKAKGVGWALTEELGELAEAAVEYPAP